MRATVTYYMFVLIATYIHASLRHPVQPYIIRVCPSDMLAATATTTVPTGRSKYFHKLRLVP